MLDPDRSMRATDKATKMTVHLESERLPGYSSLRTMRLIWCERHLVERSAWGCGKQWP